MKLRNFIKEGVEVDFARFFDTKKSDAVKETENGASVDGDAITKASIKIGQLPFKFYEVTGILDVSGSSLKSFDNFPERVGDIIADKNPDLTSFAGLENTTVFDTIDVSKCGIVDLKGLPAAKNYVMRFNNSLVSCEGYDPNIVPEHVEFDFTGCSNLKNIEPLIRPSTHKDPGVVRLSFNNPILYIKAMLVGGRDNHFQFEFADVPGEVKKIGAEFYGKGMGVAIQALAELHKIIHFTENDF